VREIDRPSFDHGKAEIKSHKCESEKDQSALDSCLKSMRRRKSDTPRVELTPSTGKDFTLVNRVR
jgi:hypothetical protein